MTAQDRNNAMSGADPMHYMNTLSSVVNKAMKEGFIDNMKVTKQGLVDLTKNKTYLPQEVRIVDFFRFEGESDPADNSIMYKIETTDGAKGTLIDAYGAYADENTNRFMAEVDHMCKRIANKDTHYH